MTFPGFWQLLILGGLPIDALGAYFLGKIEHPQFDRSVEQKASDINEPYHDAIDLLKERGSLHPGDDGFDRLKELMTPYHTGEITGFEVEERENGIFDILYLEFADGTTDRRESVQEMKTAVKNLEEQAFKSAYSNAVQSGVTLLIVGFAMQFVSYAVMFATG